MHCPAQDDPSPLLVFHGFLRGTFLQTVAVNRHIYKVVVFPLKECEHVLEISRVHTETLFQDRGVDM